MAKPGKRVRDGVFGALVALALAFGATQAVASPAPAVLRTCDGPAQYPVSSCPANHDCSALCATYGLTDGGICNRGCCTCAF